MRTRFYYLAMVVIGAAIVLNSCGNGTNLERKVKSAFQQYRDKNLGDNTSHFEIAEITSDDTLTNEAPLILIDMLYSNKHLMADDDMAELAKIKKAAESDKGHVVHTVKIRLQEKDGEQTRKSVHTFFAMEDMNNGEFTISSRMSEVKKPQYMTDLLNLGNKIVGR